VGFSRLIHEKIQEVPFLPPFRLRDTAEPTRTLDAGLGIPVVPLASRLMGLSPLPLLSLEMLLELLLPLPLLPIRLLVVRPVPKPVAEEVPFCGDAIDFCGDDMGVRVREEPLPIEEEFVVGRGLAPREGVSVRKPTFGVVVRELPE